MITSFNLGGGGGDTYTKQEIDTKVEGLESEISNKVEVKTYNDQVRYQETVNRIHNVSITDLQRDKADNETLSHYYTKEETYSKEEVDALIPEGGDALIFDLPNWDNLDPEITTEIFNRIKNNDLNIFCKVYRYSGPKYCRVCGVDYNNDFPYIASFTGLFITYSGQETIISFDIWYDGRIVKYNDIVIPNNVYTKEEVDTKVGDLKTKVDELEMFINPNVIIIGNPTNQSGQISNFSANNYLQFPFLVNFQNRPWEIFITVTTGNDVVSQHNILDSNYGLALAIHNSKLEVAMSTNGTSWNLSGYTDDRLIIEPNTTYNIKLEYNNGNGMYMLKVWDGNVYMTYWYEFGEYQSLYPRTIIIGKSLDNAYIFNGSIDLNNCLLKISGETIWTGVNKTLDPDLDNISDNGVEYINTLIDNKLNPIATQLQNILGDE